MLTFVDVDAAGAGVVWLVTLVTNAPVRAHRVDALAITTEIGHLALINVQAINGEASLHTDFIILWSASTWAVFTHGAPGQAHGAAAVSFSHLKDIT